MISKKIYFLFTIGWALFIAFLSLTPGKYIPPVEFDLIAPDTIAHFVFYALLIFPILGYFKAKKLTIYLIFFFTCVSYGIIIEFIQEYFIPGRYFGISDIYSNSIGAFIGGVIYFLTPNTIK